MERYALGNRVGNDRVHRLGGGLAAAGHHVGALTRPPRSPTRREAAESLPVRLVDGETFAATVVRAGIGYGREADRYEPIPSFLTRLGGGDGVDTGDVPLARPRGGRRRALGHATHHRRGGRRPGVADGRAGEPVSGRHARIDANAGVILGLARREPGPDGTLPYGPTDEGAALLAADPGSSARSERLHDGIRGATIVRRCLGRTRDGGLESGDVTAVVGGVGGPSESSAARRERPRVAV